VLIECRIIIVSRLSPSVSLPLEYDPHKCA
jgi:hypothetical protein